MAATMTTDRVAEAPTRRGSGTDAWLWFMLVVGGVFCAGAARSLGDPDVWWHVRTGQLILDEGIPDTEPWAFTAIDRTWVPTAWLSDVAFALVHEGLGWRGLIFLKVLLSAVLLVALARMLLRRGSTRLAAPVFVVVAVVLSPFLTERPQLISLIFVAWLAAVIHAGMPAGRLPWWIPLVGYVWANLHGMWVLVPFGLLAVAGGLVLDRGRPALIQARNCALMAVATLALAALTPVGPRLAYWPFVVQHAAGDVSEWRPTMISGVFGFAYLAVFALWIVAVAYGKDRAPRSEILLMLGIFTFGLLAARNVAPSAVLMSPWVVAALQRTFGEGLRRHGTLLVPRALTVTTGVAIALLIGLRTVSTPALAEGVPLAIVEELKSRPGTVTVFNSYSVGGVLTGFGAPEISVAIDGRTDNYSEDFVHRHFLATSQLFQWRQLLAELDPDVVVTGEGGQLYEELTLVGWRTTMVDGDFALLDPPVVP